MIQIIIFQILMPVNVVEIVEYNHQLRHQVNQQQMNYHIQHHKIQFQLKLKRKKKGKIISN